jgi:2-iminobutanoate/2-iminopropanoate deaminase
MPHFSCGDEGASTTDWDDAGRDVSRCSPECVDEVTPPWRTSVASPAEVVDSPRVPRIGPYSQAIRAGNLVYTAGQPGIDPATGAVAGDTFELQARQAFANLSAVLEDAGSRLARVIKVTCFVADPAAFPTLNALFTEFFPEAPPVRSTPIVALPRGLLFSIDAIAIADDTATPNQSGMSG